MQHSTRGLRRAGILGTAVAAVLALAACAAPATSSEPDDPAALDPATVRVGYFGGTSLWTLAEDSGAIADALDAIGASVEWNGPFAPVEASEAAKAGQIDVTSNSTATFLNEADAASDLVAFAVGRSSGDSQGIVVRDAAGISSVEDLAGKKVAVSTPGGTGEYVLLAALEAEDVDPASVEIVYIANPADGVSALASGSVDALATWDNFFASAQLVDDTSVLTTAAETEGRNWSLFVVTRGFLDEHPLAVKAVFDGLVAQADAIRDDRELERSARLADGQPTEIVDLVLGFDALTVVPIDAALLAEIEELAAQTVRFGFRTAAPDLSGNFVDVTTLG